MGTVSGPSALKDGVGRWWDFRYVSTMDVFSLINVASSAILVVEQSILQRECGSIPALYL